jgi:tetratricopeptide (TPR) repeat protein
MSIHRTLFILLALVLTAGGARADELRNLKKGEVMPPFTLATLEGAQVSRDDLAGKVVVLVFLAAQQHSSETAAVAAHEVAQAFPPGQVTLLHATADAADGPYFRRFRDKARLHEPLLLDFEQKLYGDLGLIVLPTTVVLDRQSHLRHVISSTKADYAHVLEAYIRHALGELDDEALAKRLESQTFQRDQPNQRIDRHRAAARILRESGLTADAEKELKAALAIDPAHVEARLDVASLLLATDRVEDAAKIVAEIMKEQPDHRRTRLIHGVVLYHRGELDKAAKVLEETLVLNPDTVQTHYYLGLIHEKKGELEKALEHYRQSLSRALANRPL